jgi:hypothetical protein
MKFADILIAGVVFVVIILIIVPLRPEFGLTSWLIICFETS